jgi:MmpS family membrane protein
VTQPNLYPPQTAPAAPRNGLGTAGFVLGLVGLLVAMIPIVGIVAWPMVILGLIFSIIGFTRARKGAATNKGLAIAGIVLSAIGLLVCVLWAAAFGKAAVDVNEEANRVATVQYEVTGDATNVTISYTTFGEGVSSNQEPVATLPWSKQLDTKGFMKGGSLTVSTGEEGGTVTCKVVVDGKEAKTGTATGPFALATCSDF